MGEISTKSRSGKKQNSDCFNDLNTGLESDSDSQQESVECYKCDICLRKFTRKCSFIQHTKEACLAACERTSRATNKRGRMDNDHGFGESSDSDDEDDCAVKCIICDEQFKTAEELTNHVVQDHNDDSDMPALIGSKPTSKKPVKSEANKTDDTEAADSKTDTSEMIDFELPLAKYSQVPIRIPKSLQRKKILTNNFRVTDIWRIEKPKDIPKDNKSSTKTEDKADQKPAEKTKEKERPVKRPTASKPTAWPKMDKKKVSAFVNKIRNINKNIVNIRKKPKKDKNRTTLNGSKQELDKKVESNMKKSIEETLVGEVSVTPEKEVDFDKYFEQRLKTLKSPSGKLSPAKDVSGLSPNIIESGNTESKLNEENKISVVLGKDCGGVNNVEGILINTFKVPETMSENLKIGEVNPVKETNSYVTSILGESCGKNDHGMVSNLLDTYSNMAEVRSINSPIITAPKMGSIATKPVEPNKGSDREIGSGLVNKLQKAGVTLIIHKPMEIEKNVSPRPDLGRPVVPISEVKPMVRFADVESPKIAAPSADKIVHVKEKVNLVNYFITNQRIPKPCVKASATNMPVPNTNRSINVPISTSTKGLSVPLGLNRTITMPQMQTIAVKTNQPKNPTQVPNRTAQVVRNVAAVTPTTVMNPSYLTLNQANNSNPTNAVITLGKTNTNKIQIVRKKSNPRTLKVTQLKPAPMPVQNTISSTPSPGYVLKRQIHPVSIPNQVQTHQLINAEIIGQHSSVATPIPNENNLTTFVNQTMSAQTPNTQLHEYLPNISDGNNAVARSNVLSSPQIPQQLNTQYYTPVQSQTSQYIIPANIMQYPNAGPVYVLDNNTIGNQQLVNVQLYQNQANGFTQIQPAPAPVAVSVVNGIQQTPLNSLPSYVTVANSTTGGFQLVQGVNSVNNLPYVIM